MGDFRYFDLQVNGYAGVDFNQDDLGAEALHHACEQLHHHNTRILATIITEDLDRMCARLRRLHALREQDPLARDVIAGCHVEGPFISAEKGFHGAHPADAIRAAEPEAAARLVDAAGGLLRLVTLAPEQDAGGRVTRFLLRQGASVAAGHTDASVDQLRCAIDAGLSMFTHFGNGCPMFLHRHENILQRVLRLRERLWFCFIGDGTHVPFVALSNYLAAVGLARSIVVTDAMAAAGLGPGVHRLGRWEVVVGDDMVARSPTDNHFLGAVATMPEIERKLHRELRLSDRDLQRLCLLNPQECIAGSVPMRR